MEFSGFTGINEIGHLPQKTEEPICFTFNGIPWMAQIKTALDVESQLITRAVEGDIKAFGVLYDRYLNQVYNYAYYRIGNKAGTEQITEKIFIKIFEKLHQYRNEGKGKHFLTWVFKVANREINHYKNNNGVSDDMLDEQQEAIVRALKKLSDQYYQIIVSRFFNGLSFAETARILGVDVGKIGGLQVKALEELDKRLKKDGQNG